MFLYCFKVMKYLVVKLTLITIFFVQVQNSFAAQKKCKSKYQVYGSKSSRSFISGGDLPKPTHGQDVKILNYKKFIIGYSEHYNTPLWGKHRLNSKFSKESCKVRGPRKFSCEPKLKVRSRIWNGDYDHSACASPLKLTRKKKCLRRGHIVPNADFSCNQIDMNSTYVTTNIAPQIQNSFNSGIWSTLESCVRSWANLRKDITVVTGVIYDDSSKLLNQKISIPRQFYKIIVDHQRNESISFLMENRHYSSGTRNPHNYVSTINKIESLSGFDFFSSSDISQSRKAAISKWKCK
jgi:DNA/RNA endonuclease G (NUC1)